MSEEPEGREELEGPEGREEPEGPEGREEPEGPEGPEGREEVTERAAVARDEGCDGGEDGDREGAGGEPGVSVRRATEADLVAAARILDGALLDVPYDRLREAVGAGDALVAARDGSLVGVLLLGASAEGARRVAAVAVRRPDRRAGVGRALVEAAARRAGALAADCRPEVAGFYRALGFAVEERDGRAWGEYRPDEA
jgi:N-acetylglutamate synthase-like GNAT family acetyltransferase